MKQVFGYTAPEINDGEQYVKFFQAFQVGSDFQLIIRDGDGKQTSIMVPSKQISALTEALDTERADMFWDATDPERPYDHEFELLQDYGHGVICEVQRARSVGNIFVVSLEAADDADSDDDWEFSGTKAECESALALELQRRTILPESEGM